MLAQNGFVSVSALDSCRKQTVFNGSRQAVRLQQKLWESKPKIVCASEGSKEDAARKALQQAFEGKKNLTKKWEEEIRKRESSGGDGVIGGSLGGGGGDGDMGGSGPSEPFDWEEAGEVFMATFALLLFYCLVTHGPGDTLAFVRNILKFIWRGFRLRKVPDNYEVPIRESTEEETTAASGRWKNRKSGKRMLAQ